MPKLHLSSRQSPPLHVYFSPGDPSFTMGRSGAGNRVELDCEEDIYCRVTWEGDGVWFRCEPGGVMRIGGEEVSVCRAEDGLRLSICGREFSCVMLEEGETLLSSVHAGRGESGREQTFVTSDPGAPVTLQKYFQAPLIKLAVLGGTDTDIQSWLQDLSLLKAAENGKGVITRLRQLPGDRAFSADAESRQALREFKKGVEKFDRLLAGEASADNQERETGCRMVFRISRPDQPERRLEILEPQEDLEAYRNFCAYADALWVFLPATEQEQFSLLTFLSTMERPLQTAVQVVLPDELAQGDQDPALLRYFDSVCGPGKVAVTQRSELRSHSGLPFLAAVADKVALKYEREAEVREKHLRFRRRSRIGIFALLLSGLVVGGGMWFRSYFQEQQRLHPDVRTALNDLRKALEEEQWNRFFNTLEETLNTLKENPTEEAQVVRETLSGLQQVIVPWTHEQILGIPAEPSDEYLNVLTVLEDLEPPFAQFAADQRAIYHQVMEDYRRYMQLTETWTGWRKAGLPGRELQHQLLRYLGTDSAMMAKEVGELKQWLATPRPLTVELLTMFPSEGVLPPEELHLIAFTSLEETMQCEKVRLTEDGSGKPAQDCVVSFNVHPPEIDTVMFDVQVTVKKWEKWKLPETVELRAAVEIPMHDFFSHPQGAVRRVLTMENAEGEKVGRMEMLFDMQLGTVPGALPQWRGQ